ncbi:Putative tetratricopeptide repeat domain containing family protein [Zea mays]|uniref:Putative tetratricopeptide repeat domain containing family protein n=1 Tax=Zea mays TaxID=4577 RepID=A0A1D6PFA2_MAIZE|nr:Putative tetratricopeptide repeat domain containing family protein [Zea mays]
MCTIVFVLRIFSDGPIFIPNFHGLTIYYLNREYQKAVSYYAKALTFPTKSLSAFAGLAYTYHLMDDFEAAINYYHKALWLKPDDQFCTDMLTYALESICQITARRKPGRGLLTATGGVTC